MSAHDAERIREMLRARGYEPARQLADADVVVLTTCSVREKARQKVLSAIGRARVLKSRRPDVLVVVAGCVAQQEGLRLAEAAPHVDLVVGPDHIVRLPDLLERAALEAGPICAVGFDDGGTGTFLRATETGERLVSAAVTIQKGCDERCAFCIVPSVRGPQRCRPAEEVVEEVRRVVARGAREVVLLGQTVNGYSHGGVGFARLVRMVAQVPGVSRIRYESAHPKLLDDELIEAHATVESLVEHAHLPVQSGSTRMLTAMGRGHSREDYVGWVDRLRQARPGIMVSSDLIVGYPTESEEDFLETLRLVDDVGFSASFAFKYSPRPGTAAASLDDDVSPDDKADRLRRLQAVQARRTRVLLEGLVGQEVEVLVEGSSKVGDGQLCGRARCNTVVNIDGGGDSVVGQLVRVEVTQALAHSVRGRLARSAGDRR